MAQRLLEIYPCAVTQREMVSMLKATPKTTTFSSRHWTLLHVLLVLLVTLAALSIERFRGQLALRSWKHGMEAEGEVFDPHALWPAASTASMQFSDNLARAVSGLPSRLRNYSGQLSGIVADKPGMARRGSQEVRTPMRNGAAPTDTWKDLDSLLQQSRPALDSLHRLMKAPPSDIGYDAAKRLEEDSLPNLVALRVSAQTLHAAAINDLHQSNFSGAQENLLNLISFGRLYAKDPGMINFMVRIAIIGLCVDGCWDALQANRWTDQQLTQLQQACADNSRLLLELPRVMEAERIVHCYGLKWFRSHSYETALARYKDVYQSFGCKMPATTSANLNRLYRQWVFHPAWIFAWSYEEELNYLRDSQPELQALRDLLKQRSWVQLKSQMNDYHRSYRPPVAAWRFYRKLPLAEDLPEALGSATPLNDYPYTDFSKAWLASVKNLTLNQMVITAIALKRYQLIHGRPPPDLNCLVPQFLSAAPVDLMNGQVFRYRPNSNGTFLLYSVGEDGKDDGGDGESDSSFSSRQYDSHWIGRDLVWPSLAARRMQPNA